jgi:hypothetical protein
MLKPECENRTGSPQHDAMMRMAIFISLQWTETLLARFSFTITERV